MPGPRQTRNLSATLNNTDRCVQCGLCLPHCPTYLKTRHEADSPRGRIALMEGLRGGRLSPSASLVQHLDGCLSCRACEAVCPALVPYGELIDAAQDSLRRNRRLAWLSNLGARLVVNRRFRRAVHGLSIVYRRSGARKLTQRSGILKLLGLERVESFLPTEVRPARIEQASPTPGGATVALFTGCVAEVFDRQTLAASAALLARLGLGVRIPRAQTCCGALHQHMGLPEYARELMERNLRAFDQEPVTAVISTATGCGAQLQDYAKLSDAQVAARHHDICEFLAAVEWPASIRLRPLAAKVAVHEPCSLRHVLRQSGHAGRLLARIPELEVVELPDNALCCGAAGSYMLHQPQMADALLEDKLALLRRAGADILATPNVGCALHFKRGLRQAGLDIEVVHPVTLLARQANAQGPGRTAFGSA